MMFFEAKPIPVLSPPVMASSHERLMWKMESDMSSQKPQMMIWMTFFDIAVRLSAESGSRLT